MTVERRASSAARQQKGANTMTQLTLDLAPRVVRQHRSLLAFLCAVIVLLGSMPLVFSGLYQMADRFPVQQIQVYGTFNHLSEQNLRDALEKYLEYNYFDVKLENIKTTAEQLAWVESAVIKKAWPDTIVVEIQERVAVANWGDSHLISHRHTIFHSHQTPSIAGLPTFVGAEEHAVLMMDHYRQLSRSLKSVELAIDTLTLAERMSWTLRLTNGLVIIVDDQHAIEKVQRFIALYQQMPEQDRQSMEQVDLRYENGLAIKWKNKDGDSDAA